MKPVLTETVEVLDDLKARLIRNSISPNTSEIVRERVSTQLTSVFPSVLGVEAQIGIRVRREGTTSIVMLGLYLKGLTDESPDETLSKERLYEAISERFEGTLDLEDVLLCWWHWSKRQKDGESFEIAFQEDARRRSWHLCGCVTVKPDSN